MTTGFESFGPLAHLTNASYVISVRPAGALHTASFPRPIAEVAVAVPLGFPVIRVPEDFPSRRRYVVLQVTSWSAFARQLLHQRASKPAQG